MREVKRSALLPYPAAAIFGLVADVERYPEFLPWCRSAQVLAREGDGITARLTLASGLARATFTTRNRHVSGRSVAMSLVDGPFDALEGRWDFTPVGDAGTRVDLVVRFTTSGIAGALALGPAFEAACNRLVDAFSRRAQQVFGEG